MNEHELTTKLRALMVSWESEVIEFKEANDNYPTSDIGKYFSALSNEANLRGERCGWLVFGVRNRDRSVVGTDYRLKAERLQSLKHQITQDSDPSTTFREIHEVALDEMRVVMMEVPAAPRGVPISWKGHHYARAGESLVAMPLDKLDEIRNQTLNTDWSAQPVDNASIDDLDPIAIQRAADIFAGKRAGRFEEKEIADWPTETLLDRLKLTQKGRITRAAVLLLGRPHSSYLLSPNPAQITWKLVGQEEAYEHFGPPFLLSTTEVFRRIRNIQLRILPSDELLSHEVAKYDQNVVLEALHNCIAHQDYTRNRRVLLTEAPATLTLENEGDFFEGEPEDYLGGNRTPLGYRNPYLVQAMVELNMIDQMGYGIRRMHEVQRNRYLPMPDYDLDNPSRVKLTLHGGVVDPAYSRHLMEKTSLSLQEVLALDRIQKGLSVPDDMVNSLRRQKLIEGRKPNVRVTSAVAAAASLKVEYIRNRAFDDQHYEELIVEYLKKFGKASRKDFDALLWNKLSDALDETQKRNKIGNILSSLRRREAIYNAGPRTAPEWRLMD